MKFNYRFNEAQVKQIADICANFSVLFFGTVFAPLFTGVDRVNPVMLVWGSSTGLVFLLYSLLFLKGIKDVS